MIYAAKQLGDLVTELSIFRMFWQSARVIGWKKIGSKKLGHLVLLSFGNHGKEEHEIMKIQVRETIRLAWFMRYLLVQEGNFKLLVVVHD